MIATVKMASPSPCCLASKFELADSNSRSKGCGEVCHTPHIAGLVLGNPYAAGMFEETPVPRGHTVPAVVGHGAHAVLDVASGVADGQKTQDVRSENKNADK